jgi:Na+/phosphate symporter
MTKMANLKTKAVGDAIETLQDLNEEIRQRLVCLSSENLDETDAFVLEVIQTLVQIEDVSSVVRHHLMVLDEAIKEMREHSCNE